MARNSNDRWTDEEDKRLLALRAARKSNAVIASALRRSEASVVGRLYVLKKRAANSDVAAPSSSNKRPEWRPADEQRLVEMTAAGKSLSETAAALGRTEAAVENRIYVLKLELQQGKKGS
jgi:DNA-binding NarL/FixJ family response regulator